MKGDNPFNSLRTHFEYNSPSPEVPYMVLDPNTGAETVLTISSEDYYKKFPLEEKEYTLRELLDAGVPLNSVNTHIYESTDPTDYPFSQSDLLETAQALSEKLNDE